MKNFPISYIVILVFGILVYLWIEYFRDEVRKRDKLKNIYDKAHTIVGRFIEWLAPIFAIVSLIVIAALIIITIVVFIQ